MTPNHDGRSMNRAPRIASLPRTRLRHGDNCASKAQPRTATGSDVSLLPGRRAYAAPAVAHLVIVHAGIVGFGLQVHHDRRQATDRVEYVIGSHHPVVL